MDKIKGGCTLWARHTIESEIFYNKPDKWFKILFFLTNAVNHKTSPKYTRGERFFTYEMIAEATGASFSQIKHCIEYLKKGKQIATQKKPRGVVICILKYDFYQELTNYKDEKKPAKGKQVAKQVDEQIAKQVAALYNKNDKNEKNEDIKGAKAPCEPGPLTDLQKLKNHYDILFTEKFEEEPAVKWGQFGKLFKPLLKQYGLVKLQEWLETYMSSEDKFIKESGYRLEIFPSQINKIIAEKKKPSFADYEAEREAQK